MNGAARDTLEHARRTADAELASAIDNPMILPDGRVESCGNFHGAPVAFACDFLAIAAADVGSISERRTDRLLDPSRSQGLPPFLARDPGVDSGLMLAQYTQAAMVAENRRLAVPASTDSVPTSAMQEDHVSMGWGAARKLRASLDNLAGILAIELAVAARGLELRAPLERIPDDPDTFYVHDVAVAERCRGRGVGRALATRLLDLARERGFTRAELVSVQGSAPFWEKFGFRPVKQFEYAPGAASTKMVRDLPADGGSAAQ